MKVWKSIFVAVAVLALAVPAFAQGKAIGVFFDEDATQQFASVMGGTNVYHTAYVYAVNCHQQVGGVAFKLNMDPRVHVWSAEYPNAIKFGEPEDGVAIGFTDCRPAWGGVPIQIMVLSLWTGNELMSNAEIKVVDHPTEGGILISDCTGTFTMAEGWSAFLTVTVDNDETSWGEVKGLYR
jgi:hypothetical protein